MPDATVRVRVGDQMISAINAGDGDSFLQRKMRQVSTHLATLHTYAIRQIRTLIPQYHYAHVHRRDGLVRRLRQPSRQRRRRGPTVVSMHAFNESWDMWEMHPQGSELVVCTSGSMTLHQEGADGSLSTFTLSPGQYSSTNPAHGTRPTCRARQLRCSSQRAWAPNIVRDETRVAGVMPFVQAPHRACWPIGSSAASAPLRARPRTTRS